MPNYTTVTLDGTDVLTASAWDGLTTTPSGSAGYQTGIVVFRASGAVSVESGTSISVDGLGYRGGAGGDDDGGTNGESYDGTVGKGGNDTADGSGGGSPGTDGGGGGGNEDAGSSGDGAGGAGGGGEGGVGRIHIGADTITGTTFPIADTSGTPSSVPLASVGTPATGSSISDTITISHTTSGSNRLMLVGVSVVEDPNGAPAVSTITYNSTPLAPAGMRASSDGFSRDEIWYLIAPAMGTHDVVVTLAGVPDAATAGVMTFEGVNQSTPLGPLASDIGDSSSGSVDITSAPDELVFGAMVLESSSNDNLIPDGSANEEWDLFQSPATNGGGSTDAGAGPTVAVSWSWGGADKWVIGGVSIKP